MFPVVAVNEANTKHMFDNRYGTGQSHARRHHPGDQHPDRRQHRRRRRLRLVRARRRDARPRGTAPTSSSLEVDPLRALEAVMDGFRVMPMAEAAEVATPLRAPPPATSTSSAASTSRS
jgi:adenosylhomocysteinase